MCGFVFAHNNSALQHYYFQCLITHGCFERHIYCLAKVFCAPKEQFSVQLIMSFGVLIVVGVFVRIAE